MIVRLQGTLLETDDSSIVIDRGGVGYEVLVPSYALQELAACRGREVTLHTMEYLEGAAAGGNLIPRMIGFLHPEDRSFFRVFVTVKGVGVRKGLKALAAPVAQIAADIERGDSAALARLPGIGRRTAETIVAELRGKVTAHAYQGTGVPPAAQPAFSEPQRLAIEILVQWGDTRSDAERWVARAAQLHAGIHSPEDWVRAAYRLKSGAET